MQMTDTVKKILANYEGENPGVKGNLARMLMTGKLAGTGKMIILPVDQGFEHGPLGLPVSAEAEREDGTIAQRFVGGTLVYDPETKQLSVEPNP